MAPSGPTTGAPSTQKRRRCSVRSRKRSGSSMGFRRKELTVMSRGGGTVARDRARVRPLAATMSPLTLRLLGGFDAQADPGGPLAIPTRKAQALLAYLAQTAGQAHPRDRLATLLWGEMPPGPARNALRQALFVLRKALGPHLQTLLVMTGDAITVSAHAVQTDVAAFERAVTTGTPAAHEEAA